MFELRDIYKYSSFIIASGIIIILYEAIATRFISYDFVLSHSPFLEATILIIVLYVTEKIWKRNL